MIREIKGRKLKEVYSEKQIAGKVRELAGRIRADYEGKDPILIGALKGAFIFLADLVREIPFPVQVEFVRLSSYRNGMEPGDLDVLLDLTIPVKGRHVLIVEDIIDTGVTSVAIKNILLARSPATLRICALVDNPSKRRVQIDADYVGFRHDDGFIVGYGTDWGEEGRNLREIYVLEEEG
ncbi:MAG: hypoxanthine phosphoribosyltransferase [Candidatus Dadabacteria bacterium]|nr:hypoxanthine phosphoribosyltransferase [Candidatus Dadabacteria bacterium]